MNRENPALSGLDREWFWAFVQKRQFGLVLALLSLVVVLVYVLLCTPYDSYLFSDMGEYWERTMNRLNGDEFDRSQYFAWPPMYHIFLAEIFRLFRWLGLSDLIQPRTVLIINIFVFSVSVYAFQRLTTHWFTRPELMLACSLLYAFGFPSLYFNAFILSENLAMPLLVIAFAIIACHKNWQSLIIGAILFGFATIIRPSIGPYGLSFVLLYLGRYRSRFGFNWSFVQRAAAFSVIFFAIVWLASQEVSRISAGKVTGLSANGGVDFFIATSHIYKVKLNDNGWVGTVIIPAYDDQPENGVLYTSVPFHQQDYYYDLGWEYIKRNPMRWLENLSHVRNLFFAGMLPERHNAPGFTLWRPVWDWFKFAMFLSLGLYLWMWRAAGASLPTVLFLLSTVAITLLVSYFFTGEPRYTYSIMFVFYLLFFKLLELLWNNWQRWRKILLIYVVILLVSSTTVYAVVESNIMERKYPLTVSTVARVHPKTFNEVNIKEKSGSIGRVLFPYQTAPGLKHIDKEQETLTQAALMYFNTRIEIKHASRLPVKFEVNSAWPFKMVIDGELVLQNSNPAYLHEFVTTIELEPGLHIIEGHLNYRPNPGGFAVHYSYQGDDDWRYRKTLGRDTEKVQFLPIEPIVATKAENR